jgi:hypothetical protein
MLWKGSTLLCSHTDHCWSYRMAYLLLLAYSLCRVKKNKFCGKKEKIWGSFNSFLFQKPQLWLILTYDARPLWLMDPFWLHSSPNCEGGVQDSFLNWLRENKTYVQIGPEWRGNHTLPQWYCLHWCCIAIIFHHFPSIHLPPGY